MKIFGIGFSGYIGEAVAAKLLADGHTLTGLARSETAKITLQKQGITPISGSMADTDVIIQAARKADAAVLIATGGFLTEAVGKGEQYVNCVEAFMSAFEGTHKPFMQLAGTGLWLGASTVKKVVVVDESIPPSPPRFYAELMPGLEKVQNSAARGVRGFTIHPGQVYGRRGGYINPLSRRFEDFRKNGAIHCVYPGEATVSYTHVDDLANAIATGLEIARAGESYFVITDTCDIITISRMVSRVCGLNGRLSYVDEKTMGDKCGWVGVGDFSTVLIDNSDKIKREMGWKPQGLSVVDELQRLIDEKVDVNEIYPMKSRRKTVENLKI